MKENKKSKFSSNLNEKIYFEYPTPQSNYLLIDGEYEENLNKIKLILEKDSKRRTILERKALIKYLIQTFQYFSRFENKKNELLFLSSILNIEYFNPNENIINYGEESNKFYLILTGKVEIYQSNYKKQYMKLSEFLEYIEKYDNYSEKTKFIRILLKNKEIFNLEYFLKNPNKILNNPLSQNKYNFYIEIDEKLGEYSNGFFFGESALKNNEKYEYTIKSITKTECLCINKKDYQHIINEVEQKKLIKKILNFKNNYSFFSFWNNSQILKIFQKIEKISLIKGDFLYKQNEIDDSIYIIKSGTFEIYTHISLGWKKDFLNYIIDPDNNLMIAIKNYKSILNENELKDIYNNLKSNRKKSPCFANPYEKIKLKSFNVDNYFDIIKKKIEVKDNNNLYKINIQIINNEDIIGIEDSIEFKQRFCNVKCISNFAEVGKINLYDFFKIMNLNVDKNFREKFINLLAGKKQFIYDQIIKFIKHKQLFLNENYNFNLKLNNFLKFKKKSQNNDKNIQNKIKLEKKNIINKYEIEKNFKTISNIKKNFKNLSYDSGFLLSNYKRNNSRNNSVYKSNEISSTNNSENKNYINKVNLLKLEKKSKNNNLNSIQLKKIFEEYKKNNYLKSRNIHNKKDLYLSKNFITTFNNDINIEIKKNRLFLNKSENKNK